MITRSTHAIRLRRPARYKAAAAILGLLAAVLIASSVLNYLYLDRIAGRASLYGLPSIALVTLATWIALRAIDRDPQVHRRHLLRAALLIGIGVFFWVLLIDVFTFTQSAGPKVAAACTVACLPTTAFGLAVIRRLDRNEKEPWRLVLVAAAFGAIISTSLVIWGESAWAQVANRSLLPGPGLDASTAYSAGILEELAKGVAVLLLYLLMRREFDDVVDGIVYGAAVGLGFNFMESVSYMTHLYAIFSLEGQGAQAAAVQWYGRQVLGLFFGHATYTALVGAGIGIARQLPSRRGRLLAIAAGFMVAIASHFAWDAWLAFYPISHTAFALVEVHLRTLLMGGPFTAAVLVLLAAGLQIEATGLTAQLRAEAASGSGAVQPEDVAVLASPWRRVQARFSGLRQDGPGAYFRIAQLQTSQLDLAMQRWHVERQEDDEGPETVAEMRSRALGLRARSG